MRKVIELTCLGTVAASPHFTIEWLEQRSYSQFSLTNARDLAQTLTEVPKGS